MTARLPQPSDPFAGGVDSYSRMEVVVRNLAHMSRHDWFAQLGHAWSSCDNLASWRTILRPILLSATRSELDLMMTGEERKALGALPERFEVWRGCYGVNRFGLSWTTDRKTAERFVSLSRYRRIGDQPILRRGFVRRARAVLKLDRDESEIIAARVFGIIEAVLDGPRAADGDPSRGTK